jgi:hypothetical protein
VLLTNIGDSQKLILVVSLRDTLNPAESSKRGFRKEDSEIGSEDSELVQCTAVQSSLFFFLRAVAQSYNTRANAMMHGGDSESELAMVQRRSAT